MNQHAALDAALATSVPQKKNKGRLFACALSFLLLRFL
jgi:hypothetical protein